MTFLNDAEIYTRPQGESVADNWRLFLDANDISPETGEAIIKRILTKYDSKIVDLGNYGIYNDGDNTQTAIDANIAAFQEAAADATALAAATGVAGSIRIPAGFYYVRDIPLASDDTTHVLWAQSNMYTWTGEGLSATILRCANDVADAMLFTMDAQGGARTVRGGGLYKMTLLGDNIDTLPSMTDGANEAAFQVSDQTAVNMNVGRAAASAANQIYDWVMDNVQVAGFRYGFCSRKFNGTGSAGRGRSMRFINCVWWYNWVCVSCPEHPLVGGINDFRFCWIAWGYHTAGLEGAVSQNMYDMRLSRLKLVNLEYGFCGHNDSTADPNNSGFSNNTISNTTFSLIRQWAVKLNDNNTINACYFATQSLAATNVLTNCIVGIDVIGNSNAVNDCHLYSNGVGYRDSWLRISNTVNAYGLLITNNHSRVRANNYQTGTLIRKSTTFRSDSVNITDNHFDCLKLASSDYINNDQIGVLNADLGRLGYSSICGNTIRAAYHSGIVMTATNSENRGNVIEGNASFGVSSSTNPQFRFDIGLSQLYGNTTTFGSSPDNTQALTGSGVFLTDGQEVQIASTAHGLNTGDRVYIDNIVGTVELNDRFFTVRYINANVFALVEEIYTAQTLIISGGVPAVGGASHTAYSSAGTWIWEGMLGNRRDGAADVPSIEIFAHHDARVGWNVVAG